MTDKEKKYLIVCLLVCQATCGTLYLNIVSFYPLFVDDHYSKYINTMMVSVALATFNFAGVVCTPIHAVTISRMGRKNAIVVGLVCMLISNTGLGMLALIPYERWGLFYFCSVLIRFI